MRLLLISAMAAMATLSLAAADLAGTWKGSMSTQMGETAVVITIKPGADLVGKVQAGEYEAPMENAKRTGDKISFEMRIGPGTVTYDGTVSADQMKFDVIGTQGDKYTLTCTRQ